MARARAHVTDPKSLPNEFKGSEGLWLEQNRRILLVEATREGQMKKKTCRDVTLFDGLAFVFKRGRQRQFNRRESPRVMVLLGCDGEKLREGIN